MSKLPIKTDGMRGHPRFYEVLQELAQLHNAKNTDYATQADPLMNFTRRAEIELKFGTITEGRPATKVAINDLLKQLTAGMSLLQKGETGKVEGVPDRLKDTAVYAILALILYEENK